MPIPRAFVDENDSRFEGVIVYKQMSLVKTKKSSDNKTLTDKIDILLSVRSHRYSWKTQYMVDLYAYGPYALKLNQLLNKSDRIAVRCEYKPITIVEKKKKQLDSKVMPERYPFFEIKKLFLTQSKNPPMSLEINPENIDLAHLYPDIFTQPEEYVE